MRNLHTMFALGLLVGCGGTEPPPSAKPAALPAPVAQPAPKPKPKPSIAAELPARLGSARNTPLRQRMLPAEWPAPRFVSASDEALTLNTKRLAPVQALCAELPDHGLGLEPYPCAALNAAIGSEATLKDGARRGALADIEILATTVVLQFAWDVSGRYVGDHWDRTVEFRRWVNNLAARREKRTGRKSRLRRPAPADWPASREDAELKVLADTFAALESTPVVLLLEQLTPGDEQYERLVVAHARYRKYVEAGGFTKVPNPRRLRRGKKHKNVIKLRARLAEEGFKPTTPPEDPKVFDDDLIAVLGAFQEAHQNKAYPKIGRQTARALGLTAKQKLGRIDFALEAMRQIPARSGYYVQVNVPDFHGEVWDAGRRIHRFRTVVGSGRQTWDEGKRVRPNATQMIASEIDVLVFNPYWNVPRRILEEDILPKPPKVAKPTDGEPVALAAPEVGADGEPIPFLTEDERHTWLEERGYEVMKRGTRWEYARQKPGRRNPLGRVKILFPNRHDIYLHDTPKQHVFKRTRRASSHGCVRVHEPMALAQLIMEREGADFGRVERWLRKDEPTQLVLKKRIPVFLDYVPVRVRDDGMVQFLTDIYGVMPKSLRK